jgi:hypothetical protein
MTGWLVTKPQLTDDSFLIIIRAKSAKLGVKKMSLITKWGGD